MRKVISLAALLLLFSVAAAYPQQAPAAGPRKKRVAIFDFDYATVHSDVAALFGQDVDVGKGISDLLVTYLVKDQRSRQSQLRRKNWETPGRGCDYRR